MTERVAIWVDSENMGSETPLAKAEDAAHASGDYGVQALAVRKDTATAIAGSDGDYAPLIVDSSGQLYVAVGQLPAALGANGGMKVEGVAGGVAQPVSGPLTDTQLRATAVPVSGPLTDTQLRALAVAVKAQLIDDAGVAFGVPVVDGMPKVSATPYYISVAEGDMPGHSAWSKLGYNGNVGTTEADIWALGGTYVWPATAQQMQLVSTSAKDVGARAITAFADAGGGNTTVTCGTHGLANADAITISGTTNYNGNYVVANAGTNSFTIVKAYAGNDATGALAGPGARQVIVYYLDGSYAEKSETVTLNGLNAVNTTATDLFRIQGLRCASTGTTYYAVGNVTLKNTGASVTYSQISAGYTRARNITYTVPANKTLYVTSFTVSVHSATKGVRFTTRATYDPTEGVIREFFLPFTEVTMTNGAFQRSLEMPTMLPAMARLKISAIADAAGAVCSVSLRGWVESNSEEPAGAMMSMAMAGPVVHPAPMGLSLWERLRGK